MIAMKREQRISECRGDAASDPTSDVGTASLAAGIQQENSSGENHSGDIRSWLSSFACFLRQYGYDVTSGDTYRIFCMLSAMDSPDDFDDILSLFMAKTERQAEMLPYYRKKFDSTTERDIQKNQKDIEDIRHAQASEQSEYDRAINQIENEKKQAIEEAEENFRQSHIDSSNDILDLPLTDSDLSLVDASKRDMLAQFAAKTQPDSNADNVDPSDQTGQSDTNEQDSSHAESMRSSGTPSTQKTISLDDMKQALAEAMTSAMWNGDMDAVMRIDSSIKAIDAARQRISDMEEKLRKARQEASHSFDNKISDMKKQAADAVKARNKEIAERQKAIDAILAQEKKEAAEMCNPANGLLKVKDFSSSHRTEDIFSSVAQSIDSGTLGKNLSSLSDKEYRNIYNILRKNAVSLYTRMTRNIKAKFAPKLNIAQTIKMTCKTGGIPYSLIREKPKPSKAKMILVLDISGSCSSASKMMLTMMHAVSRVFPRGVKVYVFVNALYDVSDIMDTDDVYGAINKVFETVPTRGVYSAYDRPMRSLWEEHACEITKDTMCIFIGDARNNKNPSGEEYVKNIARKSKKSYWLNTEQRHKWDTGDSIAGTYAKYMQMVPVLTVGDIIEFIESMK